MPPRTARKPRPPATLAAEDLGYVRLPVILELYPVGESSWWRGVQNGIYPKPVKLSTRVCAWRISDIRRLLQSRAASTEPSIP
jgi:prophage regulatory protein